MPTNFVSLPGELRNEIYHHLLVCEEPVSPWDRNEGLAPNILCANKAINYEASSILYGRNCFDLTQLDSKLIFEFLDQIGHHNANHLQCLYVNFPIHPDVGEDDISLEDDSFRILTKILTDCPNLETIIISADSIDFIEFMVYAFENPRTVDKALAHVDARVKALSSVSEIIVNIYEDGPSPNTRSKIESYGWLINVVEREE